MVLINVYFALTFINSSFCSTDRSYGGFYECGGCTALVRRGWYSTFHYAELHVFWWLMRLCFTPTTLFYLNLFFLCLIMGGFTMLPYINIYPIGHLVNVYLFHITEVLGYFFKCSYSIYDVFCLTPFCFSAASYL